MENRGTGLTPNRLPAEWEKSALEMTRQPDQGPSVTMGPTSRSLIAGGSFSDAVIRNRPGSAYGESRSAAQAPIPSEVIDAIADAPGGYINQTVAGIGSFASEAQDGGGPGNISGGSYQGVDAQGSATRTTGRPIMGKTLGKGTI